MRNDRFVSNIAELDTLLGSEGIPYGSIIQLAGEPGTGKTTLAWELVRNCNQDAPIVFLSCDELAEKAWTDYRTSYRPLENVQKYDSDQLILYDILNDSEDAEIPGGARIRVRFRKMPRDPAGGTAADSIVDIIRKESAGILIIDGLNSFIDVAQNLYANVPPQNERAIRGVLRSLKAELRRLAVPRITIFTCERRDDRDDRLYESYLADVVLDLRREHLTPDPTRPELGESIMTCGLLKGRGIHIQRRRICYDFEPESRTAAIRFYETYPAEGLLSLFHENHPQRAFVTEFRQGDIPTLYPRLSLREFDLTNMYHEYAMRRRGRDIPSRRPLMVMNIDEYWVGALDDNGILEPLKRRKLNVFGLTYPEGQFVQEIPPKWRSEATEELLAIPHFANVSMYVFRKSLVGAHLHGKSPGACSLIDVESLCAELKRDGVVEYPLRLEVKHVDTFACTLLELIISHGGTPTVERWPTEGGYSLKFTQSAGLDGAGISALQMLQRWVHELRIVRPFGTIDPTHPSNWSNGKPTWAVARHWYSSLINTLFPNPSRPEQAARQIDTPQVRDIAVAPVPAAAHEGRRCCMWGEWYLAVEKGVENLELAYALINNFLAPSKLINHAMTGSGLPICEEFFREFGDVQCIGTDKTYAQIRDLFFQCGVRRSDIAEYRTVMQRLYAAGLQIVQKESADPVAVWTAFRHSVETTRIPQT
jgi:KaiC/GvpD/RAD55 family RecA-like ATPase